MLTPFILVIWLGNAGVATAEFSSLAACEVALLKWQESAKAGPPRDGFCVATRWGG